MKKMILVLSMMLISASVYAIEYSVGLSAPGFGVGILRGEDAKTMTDVFKEVDAKSVFAPSFAPAFQLDFMVEFLPFLALETGIGWTYSSVIYEMEDGDFLSQQIFQRNELTIPIMIRGQYEADKFVAYGSVGVKLGIPLAGQYMYGKEFKDGKETDASKKRREDSEMDNYSALAMDIAFAIGGEYRITGAHYVGLRLGYDLNVLSPLDAKKVAKNFGDEAKNFEDFYQDNFNVSLSYRYAFNSKWNN